MLEREQVGTPTTQGTVYGGFQCDDMGLGKTIQMAAVLAHHRKPKTLLLVPLAMVETWVQVCLRVGFKVFQLKGEWIPHQTSGCPILFRNCWPAVYITNYHQVPAHPSLFARQWDRMVLDEAHQIRNPDSVLSTLVKKIAAPIRWAMTGTPLVNSWKDVANLMDFLGVPCHGGQLFTTECRALIPAVIIHRSLSSLRIEGAPPEPEIISCVLPFCSEKEEAPCNEMV